MDVIVNGKDVKLEKNDQEICFPGVWTLKFKSLDRKFSIKEILELLKVEIDIDQYVTIQLNDVQVENENFATTLVKQGDVMEFLYFVGGGSQ